MKFQFGRGYAEARNWGLIEACAFFLLVFSLPALAEESLTGQSGASLGLSLDSGILNPPGGQVVVFQGLDKITAHIFTFEVSVGEKKTFGTLSVQPHYCHRTPPEEPPESEVFVTIYDNREKGNAPPIFSGWMFASSPALSAVEHPIHDVWVLSCRYANKPQSAPPGIRETR